MTGPLSVEVEDEAGALALRAGFTLNEPRAALFGPSGSGKTTLLRIVAGLLTPRLGVVRLGERMLLNTAERVCLPAGARGVGFVTQQATLFPHLSVEANLRFGLRGLVAAEANRRVAEVSRLLDLGGWLERRPGRLSGGERQRVALGRALAPGPALLLLDEPFSALDAKGKTELWDRLEIYLHERGIARLLVTHDPGEVWSRADTVVRIANGVAREQGPPQQLLRTEREQALAQWGALPVQA